MSLEFRGGVKYVEDRVYIVFNECCVYIGFDIDIGVEWI
jgi:hypothetical protein